MVWAYSPPAVGDVKSQITKLKKKKLTKTTIFYDQNIFWQNMFSERSQSSIFGGYFVIEVILWQEDALKKKSMFGIAPKQNVTRTYIFCNNNFKFGTCAILDSKVFLQIFILFEKHLFIIYNSTVHSDFSLQNYKENSTNSHRDPSDCMIIFCLL